MVKSVLAVCMLVVTVYLSAVLSASINDERILGNNLNSNKFGVFGNKGSTRNPTNLTCPSDPVCNLTSIRCKRNSDCYPTMPVCCAGSAGNSTQGIRCCSPASSTQSGPVTCPGSNPPPACLRPDVCAEDGDCFTGERCCRTYFAGRLLNFSCCVAAARGPQCPDSFQQDECFDREQCGDNNQCPAGRVCCAVGNSTTIRCCVFPRCSDRVTSSQCNQDNPAVCDGSFNCLQDETCCHPRNAAFSCCARSI